MKKRTVDFRPNRMIQTSTHAIIPAWAYKKLLREMLSLAQSGDAEAAQWFINELIIRDKEARRAEYNTLRINGKLDHLKGQSCVNCGKPANTIDHIIPLSRGGTNDLENLQPMCWDCNKAKGSKQ